MQLSSRIPLIVVFLGFTSPLLLAQEVVHAAQGTLTTINTTARSITILMSDGTQTTYQDETKSHHDLEFDKKLRGQAVDVGNFNKNGNQVVVYHFGGDTRPTAVAVKNLGAQALTTVSGDVVKSERHSFSLKTAKGDTQMFQIAPTATVETSEGVVEGKDFSTKKEEHVSVEYPAGDSTRTAVFLTAE